MHILLTNDDGIHAPGIKAMYDELSKVADVTVVAPSSEKSGASRSLTIKNIIKVDEVHKDGKFFGYGIHGTPVDCMMLAFQQLLDKKIDYVFSGINKGANVSGHVRYSGTVSAAAEGLLQGITSVAVSLTSFEHADFTPAAIMARRWLEIMEKHKQLPAPALYNINIPPLAAGDIKGFAPALLSDKNFGMVYEKRVSPFGAPYFWLAKVDFGEAPTPRACEPNGDCPPGPGLHYSEEIGKIFEPEIDISVLEKGYASVTPLTKECGADVSMLEILKKSGVFTNEK